MDSFEKHERMQDARRRLRAQRQRAGQLRGRVVAISLIGFVLLWGVVFAQMATGNDPVLGDRSAIVATSPAAKKHSAKGARELPVEPSQTATEESAELEAAEIEAAQAQAIEAEPEPVTTSQS
ncbi:MAG TPA: hypothetical protein VLL27_00960 [Solirubrobacterales bacterium]|nr:hypothetical protein [Solirubrobacterales bacterium]